MRNSSALFAGVAWYYARYRPGYSPAFFNLIVDRFGLDGHGSLLDLGCGTGQLILPLAGRFERAIGMDPDPDMLAEAKVSAEKKNARNVTWIQGGSDDLERLQPQLGEFRLVVMGRSFHWMDGEATLRALAGIIEPGGGVVIAGDGCGLWNGTQPWEQAIKATVQRWLGEERRAGSEFSAQVDEPWETYIPRIAAPEFDPIEFHQFTSQRVWTIKRILGHLYSTSFCSIPQLGDNREAFEQDLRNTLLEIEPKGSFIEDVTLDTVILWKA